MASHYKLPILLPSLSLLSKLSETKTFRICISATCVFFNCFQSQGKHKLIVSIPKLPQGNRRLHVASKHYWWYRCSKVAFYINSQLTVKYFGWPVSSQLPWLGFSADAWGPRSKWECDNDAAIGRLDECTMHIGGGVAFQQGWDRLFFFYKDEIG